ncbi:hypothetical protein LguiA_008234 [Lonicera macranthoides]
MASSYFSNPDETNSNREPKRKKQRIERIEQINTNRNRWKTDSEQQIYKSKLISALRQVRRNSPSPATSAVKDTADRVLAVTAKGRTRWSRAILNSRLRMKKINVIKHKKIKKCNSKLKVTGDILSKKRSLPLLQRKVRVLGRLVPGCRKLSFPNLLEEATDYIAALEMQVKAMATLTGLLTGAGGPLDLP